MTSVHIRAITLPLLRILIKMGGMKANLNELTREIILWCKNRNIWLTAAHLPGVRILKLIMNHDIS